MDSKQTGDRHLLRIDRGEEIADTVSRYLQEHDIRAAGISGIGAADEVTLRYYDLEKKEYVSRTFTGQFEIASLTGNVSVMDGTPWPHLHIVLGDTEYRCFGGHLESAVVGVTCEVIIDQLHTELPRLHDEETGLKLWGLR